MTAFRREVAALLDPAIALQHQAHKAGLAAKAKLDRPAELLEQSIDRACRDFERQQERIADEQERLLQEQARREEEDRILAEAQLAQDIGDPAAAEAIVAEPVAPAIVHVAPRVAQVEGVTRRNLPAKAVVYDKRAFIKYVAEHPELDDCLEATPKLNALARAMGTNMKIPGVRVVVETTTAVKAS